MGSASACALRSIGETMEMTRTLAFMMLAAVATAGCSLTRPVPADVRVPPELLRGSPWTAGGEARATATSCA